MSSSTAQIDRQFLDVIIPIGLFVFALGVRAAFWAYHGTSRGADTSGYLEVCSLFQQNFMAALQSVIGIEYLGFTAPFCTFLTLFNTITGWIIVQLLLSATGVVFIYLTAKVTVNRTAGVVAGGSLAVLWDSFQWDVYVLSDSIFVFVMTVALWAMATHYIHGSPRTRMLTLGSLGYLAITRPFGIPIFFAIAITDQFVSDFDLLPQIRGMGPGLAVISGAIVLFSQRIAWVLRHVTEAFRSGTIVMNDSMMVYPFIPEGTLSLGYLLSNIHHFVIIAILRILVFFLPVMPRFSFVHNLVNVITLFPVMLLAAVGVVRLSRERKTTHLLMWVAPLIAILLIVSVTFVDWDWRYRAPAGPLLVVLAGYTIGTDPRVASLRNRLKSELQTRTKSLTDVQQ